MHPAWPALGRRLLASSLLVFLFSAVVRGDDWPQWLGPQRDGVWRESGILERFPKEGLKVRWRTPVGGGYSGPAVAGGRVYLTDRVLPDGVSAPASGFSRATLEGKERVLCLDEATGKVLWTHAYDCTYRIGYPAGPRATPAVAGGKVYTLGTMGDLCCLDAESGKLLWSKNFPKEYGAPLGQWGASAHPLVDGDRLICMVGGTDSAVVAFHKDTGKELWRALAAPEPGYSPPMIYQAGGKRQLIIWHPEAVAGLDPETGKVHWTQRFLLSSPSRMSISTPRYQDGLLFLTAFYDGSLMLKLAADKPEATQLWRRKGRSEKPDQTEALHSIISTPVLRDGHVYGVCSYGELRCLKAETGDRVWEDLKATGSQKTQGDRWKNAFLVEQGDRFFLFNEHGQLIIARLTPGGYEEIDRTRVLEPTNRMANRLVVWMHPAFANRSMYARNDKEIVCVSLAAE
jgi:outer membrane protein assembly factor BamB